MRASRVLLSTLTLLAPIANAQSDSGVDPVELALSLVDKAARSTFSCRMTCTSWVVEGADPAKLDSGWHYLLPWLERTTTEAASVQLFTWHAGRIAGYIEDRAVPGETRKTAIYWDDSAGISLDEHRSTATFRERFRSDARWWPQEVLGFSGTTPYTVWPAQRFKPARAKRRQPLKA